MYIFLPPLNKSMGYCIGNMNHKQQLALLNRNRDERTH